MSVTVSPASPRFSPRTVGMAAAVVTVLIWTFFIVYARASADPARGGLLTPFDILYARLWGAGLVLLPAGWWMVRQARRTDPQAGSLFGLSPLPLRHTVVAGVFGSLLYGMLAYSGFVFAPAAHASVLMPGSLPLWTSLLAIGVLGERISGARAVGLVCIVAGDLLVGGASLLHALDGSGVWRGDVLFMLASFTWSVYSVTVRRLALEAVRATVAITVLGFLAFVPAYTVLLALQWVPGHVFATPWHALLPQMLFQGLGSVVISGITFNVMIRYFGPVRSTMITALVPGLSALSAGLFLGEPLQWNLVMGLALVTIGILFGVRKTAVAPVPIASDATPARAGG